MYVDGVLLTNNVRDFPFLGVIVIGLREFLGWCESAAFDVRRLPSFPGFSVLSCGLQLGLKVPLLLLPL